MTVRTLTAVGVLVLAGSGVLLGGTAQAQEAPVCDSYSGACVPIDGDGGGADTDTDDNTDNGGSTAGGTGGSTVDSPATLPFTGGELVLMTTIGLGALAGGTALVIAGRRKTAAGA